MATKSKDVYSVNPNTLKFDDVSLIRVGGMSLLGAITNKVDNSVSVVGIEVAGMPKEGDFVDMLKGMTTNTCIKTTVSQANDVVELEMGADEEMGFEVAIAKFKLALKRKDQILTGMALNAAL